LAFSLGGEGATQDFEGSTDRYPLRAGGDSGPQSWSNRLDLLAKHCLLRYVLSDFATRVSQRMPWPEKKTIQIGIHIRAVRFVVGALGHLSKSVMPADVRRRNDVLDAIFSNAQFKWGERRVRDEPRCTDHILTRSHLVGRRCFRF
jgi:hypothetical protein